MIDEVDDRVTDWVKEVLGEVEVSLEPPKEEFEGIQVYLLDLKDHDQPSSHEPEGILLNVLLRYLICTGNGEPRQAHRRLAELLFAAKQHQEFEPRFERLSAETWIALGIAPRPAFYLEVPLSHMVTREVHRVEHDLALRFASLSVLEGHVLGHDKPLANALVELPALRRSMRTGYDGRFRFARVPRDPDLLRLRIKARGEDHEFQIESIVPEKPLIVRFFDKEVVHG